MDFLTMQKELATRLSAYDETVTDDATILKRWLNLAKDEILGKWNWPFLQALDIVQTIEDVTTGTIAITAADTAVTFSSAPAVSVVNRYIQFQGTNDWYEITSHTAASTSATIGDAYLGDTLTTGTYTVREIFYSLPSTVDRVLSVSQATTPTKMAGLSYVEYQRRFAFTDSTGTPYVYWLYKQDSSGNWQIGFYPFPDDTINVWITYLKKSVNMSSDTDTGELPVKFQYAILDMATFYGFSQIDDTRDKIYLQKALDAIANMKMDAEVDLGKLRVMRSIDERVDRGSIISPLLPAAFGPMSR